MAKTRNISVYLLKDSVDSVEDALRNDSGFTEVQDYTDDNNGILYFKQNDSNICWWSTYLDIDILYNKSHAAAYFLKYNNRIFVFCFGQGRYAIREELLVEDFGHKSALNALDPEKLKKSISYLPEHTGKSQAIQASNYTTLVGLGYDGYSNILKNIAGKTKDEYKDIILNVEGATSLRIGTKLPKSELNRIAEKLLFLYQQDIDTEAFPNIDKIKIVKDKEIINQLDEILLEKLNNQEEDLSIIIPEFFGENDVQHIKYVGVNDENEFSDLDINDFYILLDDDHVWDIESLKLFSVFVQLNSSYHNYKLKKCLVCEADIDRKKYYLYNDKWYEIQAGFLQLINSEIEDVKDDTIVSLEYSHADENEYNLDLAEQNNWKCFDQNNVNVEGYSTIEVCDVYDEQSMRLIHIKRKHGKPSTLSHLFNQGIVSKDLIINHNEKVKQFFQDNNIDYPDSKNMKIHYVIIGKASARSGEVTLPLFSKITLWHAIKSFQSSQVKISWSTVRKLN